MKRTRGGFTLLQAIFSLVCILIVAAFLFPLYTRDPSGDRNLGLCQSNLKQIGLSFALYTQDYNSIYPPAGTISPSSDTGWVRRLNRYTKDTHIYQCPKDDFNQDVKPQSTRLTDYYFNKNLAGAHEEELVSTALTLLAGEGEAASSNYACSSFDSCIGSSDYGAVRRIRVTSRTRHLDGCNYLFADGHVKRLVPARISLKSPDEGNPTFALK